MSLTAKTASGVFWNFSQQLASRGIGMLATLLMARFLVPEDFGLVAMMAVFIALGNSLMESGFREALIRCENLTQVDYSTAFYANIFLGIVAYSILFSVAPLVASFYKEPRLIDLIRLASLTIIIMSFQIVQIASLSKSLNFKAQLKASLPASFIAGTCSVYLAYIGFGVWALVIQLLVNAFIQTILLWMLEGWRPVLQFSWASFKDMYSFGYKLFLSGVLDVLFQNLYVIVIAKIFSSSIAGLYFFAHTMKELIIQQLVRSIQAVTYPALATAQNNNVRLKQGYKKIIILMTIVLFPCVLFIAVLAEAIFIIILPDKWFSAIPIFQLLCVSSLMMPLHSINLNILKVKGESGIYLYLEIIKKAISGLMLFATYRYGIMAILFGQIVTSFINYIPNSYFSSKILNYGVREQINDFAPLLIIALISAAVGHATLSAFDNELLLGAFFASVFMVFVYALLVFIFQRQSWVLVLSILRKIKK